MSKWSGHVGAVMTGPRFLFVTQGRATSAHVSPSILCSESAEKNRRAGWDRLRKSWAEPASALQQRRGTLETENSDSLGIPQYVAKGHLGPAQEEHHRTQGQEAPRPYG